MIYPMKKVFSQWGRPVTVWHGELQRSVNAILQHVSSVSRQSRKRIFSPLGEVPVGAYLLMLPPEETITPGDRVVADGAGYAVRRAEVTYVGNTPLYIWGICEKEGGAATWGS